MPCDIRVTGMLWPNKLQSKPARVTMNQNSAFACTLRKAIRSTPPSAAGRHPGLFFGMSRAIAAGALALAFLASGIQTRAQNTTDVWQLNGDGIFGNLVNWSPQVPIGGD